MQPIFHIPRWLIAIAVLALLAAPTLAQGTALSPTIIDAVDRAIVQVTVIGESGGRVIRGSGSGFIIDPSGLVLTANHVVARSTRIEVLLRTGETLPAQVVGFDPVFDTALLRLDPRGSLPTASLGDSAPLQRGDIVSAFGRAPRRQAGPSSGAFMELDLEVRAGVPYLRSSAIVYPGDSGGALINDRGDVIGLIVAITRDGAVSLAVAIDAIKSLMPELRTGMVRHPWIGIIGVTITTELVQELGLAVRSGVLILEVVESSPASVAGLRGGRASSPRETQRGGDIIVAVDGNPMPTFGSLAAYILGKRIGDVVTLEIFRDGQVFATPVVLAERPTP